MLVRRIQSGCYATGESGCKKRSIGERMDGNDEAVEKGGRERKRKDLELRRKEEETMRMSR